MSWDSEDTIFRVVVNHEEQYSIWPDYLDMPNGWREVGVSGGKQHCLDYINGVWTDMRPLSLRKYMDEHNATSGVAPPSPAPAPGAEPGPRD
jgi:MbtH protein